MSIVVLLATALLLPSNSGTTGAVEAQGKVAYVTAATVRGWLDAGKPVTLLDVREADEFEAAHIPGAINVVWSEVASMADRLPRAEPIVLYCIHSSHRAPAAARALGNLGFDHVSVLEGGIVAWQTGGQTIVASERGNAPRILETTERCQKLVPKAP